MSALSPELAAGPSAIATSAAGDVPFRRQTTRRPFPVGARFPRRTVAERLSLSAAATATAVRASVFPIGARFPRRSDADAVVYLAEVAAAGGTGPVVSMRTYPVGARFPHRNSLGVRTALAG